MANYTSKRSGMKNLIAYLTLGLSALPLYNQTSVYSAEKPEKNLELKLSPPEIFVPEPGHKGLIRKTMINYHPSLERFLEHTKEHWKDSNQTKTQYAQYFNSLDKIDQRVVEICTSKETFNEYLSNLPDSEKKAAEDFAKRLTKKQLENYASECPLLSNIKSYKNLTEKQKHMLYQLERNKKLKEENQREGNYLGGPSI